MSFLVARFSCVFKVCFKVLRVFFVEKVHSHSVPFSNPKTPKTPTP